jgi:16S rRNA (guanine966-N2)-methyltransferase
MLERSRKVADALKKNLEVLGADNVTLLSVDALDYLVHADEAFDLIFLDPPFGQGLLEPVLELLFSRNLVKPNARVYIEFEASAQVPKLPEGWELIRDKKAGDVRYGLIGITQ